MPAITVPYGIATSGYRLQGNVRSGLKATVPIRLNWSDAITFVNQVLVAPHAEVIGLITWNVPLQFPIIFGNGRAPAMYCQSFDIQPYGVEQDIAPGTGWPNSGLGPGEFYTQALVTLEFESITYIQQASDDPNGLNQLDPSNPITACEQSVKLRSKMRTVKGRGYKFRSSGKPVPGDMAMPETEAVLVLKFPRVPYLPWTLVAPYMGKLNAAPMLGATTGALILDGMDTELRPQPDGSMGQAVVLEFVCNLPGDPQAGTSGAVGTDWNMQPTGDGTGAWDFVVDQSSGSVTPIGYADFRDIFNYLQF
jgi:hypothetical protein